MKSGNFSWENRKYMTNTYMRYEYADNLGKDGFEQ